MKRVDTISVSHLKHIDYRGSAKPYNTTEKRTRLDDVQLVRTVLILKFCRFLQSVLQKHIIVNPKSWNFYSNAKVETFLIKFE